jgi:ABC-type dipeptide/oligopeptide/nickel transport system permease component
VLSLVRGPDASRACGFRGVEQELKKNTLSDHTVRVSNSLFSVGPSFSRYLVIVYCSCVHLSLLSVNLSHYFVCLHLSTMAFNSPTSLVTVV